MKTLVVPEEEPTTLEILLAACELAHQHLEALRLEAGIGNMLPEPMRDVFRFVDEELQAAIAKAKDE